VGKGSVLDLRPVGFFDDNTRNKGKQVNGYPVLGTLDTLESFLEKNSISEIILAIDDIPKEKLGFLSGICLSYQIPLRRFQPSLQEIPT
jgi:FlaA1/EpsC-like NDP-sugar epimerase